jgi:effector-binding domain-containing protein
MGFPLKEIGDILTGMKEGREFTLIAPIFEKRLGEIKSAILREKSRERMIRSMMKAELENDGNMFAESKMNREEITEGSIGPWCILSHRYRGRYDEAGRHFSRLFRLGGIHADGRRGSFYYDGEYREDDADVECFILLKKQIESRDSSYASVRQIPEFRSLSLTHTGAYESIGGSYQRLYREFKERHLDVLMPTGTLYLKGPGIFFRGDPDHYRTQIFFPIA